MKHSRRGFTLVEIVVTIAILGIVVGVSAIVVSNLSSVQRGASSEVAKQNEVDAVDDVASAFVSFVSLDTYRENNGLTFAYDSSNPHSLTYTCSTYQYTLSFSTNPSKIAFSTTAPEDATPSYLVAAPKKAINLKNVTGITFNFDETIHLLVLKVAFGEGLPYRLSYIVRAAA